MVGIKRSLWIAPIKTLWFNFRYFPFLQAIRIPVVLTRRVNVTCCYRWFCELRGGVKTGMLKFGILDRESHLNSNCLLSIKGKLVLNGTGFHSFGPGTELCIGKQGVLTIGNNFSASARNIISCSCAITIGDDNMWSYENVVMDTDTHQICDENGNITNYNKPIVFGKHVWLGCRNIVMKGCEIADGCMVASGSKISGRYEEKNCIISTGKKIIKRNIIWKRDWAINDRK